MKPQRWADVHRVRPGLTLEQLAQRMRRQSSVAAALLGAWDALRAGEPIDAAAAEELRAALHLAVDDIDRELEALHGAAVALDPAWQLAILDTEGGTQ